MDDLFRVPNSPDGDYARLRDSADHVVYRTGVESLWQRFYPFADADFVDRTAKDFQSRFWEMYLGCILIESGHSLCPKIKAGPDFRVTAAGAPICLEAIAVSAGTGPDAVPSDEGDEACLVPEDLLILRLRSAIWDKHKVYLKYLKAGIVSPSDPYVIAVNGNRIPFSVPDGQPSYIVRSVFPFGMDAVTVDANAQILRQGYQFTPAIQKIGGSQVSTTVFQDSTYAGISAVIYSCVDVWNAPVQLGQDFRIVHNPQATNPIDLGWLKVGIEFWAQGNELLSKNWTSE
jgi:hypothetical protein